MAKIDKMIKGLTGQTEEEQRLKEQFSFLQKMARAKCETFESELKVMLSNKETAGAIEIGGRQGVRIPPFAAREYLARLRRCHHGGRQRVLQRQVGR